MSSHMYYFSEFVGTFSSQFLYCSIFSSLFIITITCWGFLVACGHSFTEISVLVTLFMINECVFVNYRIYCLF